MPGLTSSYPVLTHFLYAFSRIELNPHSETMGIWMIFAFSILYMSFGIYKFIRGYRTDKEERFKKKRAEKLEDLDKAIEHYRVLLKNSSEIIYKTDLKGTLTYVNPAATKLLQYSEEELLGKNYLELIRPDHRELTELFYRKQLRSETETTFLEFPAVAKNGEEIWLAQNVQLLNEGKDYAVSGLLATARDISSQRATEEKLKSNEELFHQFIRHTPAAP